MDNNQNRAFTDSIAYLKARLDDCLKKPNLNRHSIAEYSRYIEVAETKSPEEYVKFAGDMFSIAKAEQLDRIENRLKLYEALQYKTSVEAYSVQLAAVNNSKGHAEIYSNLDNAQKQTAALIPKVHEIQSEISTLIAVLCNLYLSYDKSIPKHNIPILWKKLQALDPEITWKKIMSFRPYRCVSIFDDERMNVLGTLLAGVIG